MFKKKWFWIVVTVVLLIIAGGFYWITRSDADAATYRFDKVSRGNINVSISATGTLSAVTTVQVGSQVSGTIAKLYADFNSVVKEGQLLAQLDPTFLQATVNEQRASKDRAQAQVNESDRNFRRMSELATKNLVSQAELDAAATSLETSRAQLKQALASLERAEVNLRYATVRAPISGVVISRSVDVGQTVAASLQAPTLFSIANDLKKMQVQASIDEADIGNVKVDQDVSFRVDAYPERDFEGVVSQIRLAPVVNQNVVTYTVIIAVDNPRMRLMPGMTATVTIEIANREDVLRVPGAAVRFTPPEAMKEMMQRMANREGGQGGSGREGGSGGGPGSGMGGGGWDTSKMDSAQIARFRQMRRDPNRGRVWVMRDGKPEPVPILRGIQNSQFVEVVEGDLKEGDEIIVGMVGGQATQIRPGQSTNPFQPQTPMSGGRRGGF